MAGGAWFGVVASANLETDDPVFGPRRWTGPNLTCFWAPHAMPSDHFVLGDSQMTTLFVHLDPVGLRRFGLHERQLSSWSGHAIASDQATFAPMLAQTEDLLAASAAHEQSFLLRVGQDLAAQMLSSAGLLPAELSDTAAVVPMPDMERLYQARDLLLADLRCPPSVVELARHCGTNARKLTEQFSAVFGMTPFAYLKHYRLEQALEALRRGDQPISSVAAQIGYRPAHLSATFRARFGHSPRDYRTGKSTIM